MNALIWRIHEQDEGSRAKLSKKKQLTKHDLSIWHGRSMCVSCHHTLAWYDLLPVISWIQLKGKCRYCQKAISIQYPAVELLTVGLFVLSYYALSVPLWGLVAWLLTLTGLIALAVYDLRWMILPTRLVYVLYIPSVVFVVITTRNNPHFLLSAFYTLLSALLLGGLFWLLFQVSGGKWIGGGDVRLGYLLGLLAMTPVKTTLLLFLASLLGTMVALPLLATHKSQLKAKLPFGPFLIAAAIIVVLYGANILSWYNQLIYAGIQ